MAKPFASSPLCDITALARVTVTEGRGTKGWSKNLAGLAYAVLAYAGSFIDDEVTTVSVWGTYAEFARHWELVKRRVRHRHGSVVDALDFYATLLKTPGRSQLSPATIQAEVNYLTRIVWQDRHIGEGETAARVQFRLDHYPERKVIEFVVEYTREEVRDHDIGAAQTIKVHLGGDADWLSREQKRDVELHTEALLAALRRAESDSWARQNVQDIVVSAFDNQLDALDKFRDVHPWARAVANYVRDVIVSPAAWEEAKQGVLQYAELVRFCWTYASVLGFHMDTYMRAKVEEYEEFSPEFRSRIKADEIHLMRTDLFAAAGVPEARWIPEFMEAWGAWTTTGIEIIHDLTKAARRYRQASHALIDWKEIESYIEQDKHRRTKKEHPDAGSSK